MTITHSSQTGEFSTSTFGEITTSTHILTKTDSTLTSSMFRDLLQGAPVEAQQIIGVLVRRARVHQIPTPLLDLTDLNLRVYEQQRHA
ncbi:ketopantoate reductase C-terminal domain-containing protein, partial [Komagataeibacter xylinus]|uniref:ketopantoate reductase C-terminal domain-containing protein n=1 Tax=Komagataeibacter xylinus TaxID=28448 RepID=UPI0023B07959